jgi:hypothetical protein
MSILLPSVPVELTEYIDKDVREAHARWQTMSLGQVVARMPEPTETKYGRAVILEPEGDFDENRTVVLCLPHQQAWKPSTAIRALFMQDAVAPSSRLVVLPNNTVGQKPYYTFDNAQAETIASGRMFPFYENQTRLLEKLGIQGEIDLTGYSLGAMTAAGIASMGSEKWRVRVVNADEAPNKDREVKDLKVDFLKSGTWTDHRQAIRDTTIPVLADALSAPRLAADYARFGLSTRIPENVALEAGMAASNFNFMVQAVAGMHAGIVIKLGQVAGSRITDVEGLAVTAEAADTRGAVAHVMYTGHGAHRHATADNVVAHALMYSDALSRLPSAR